MEIEVKLKVIDHESVIAAIKDVGGEKFGKKIQTDIYFGNSDLIKRKEFLRVRHTPDNNELTFKNSGYIQDDVHVRIEHNVTVSDDKITCKILKSLGYKEFLTIKKQRTTFKVRSCLVELDVVEDLGTFVEIEGPSIEKVNMVKHLIKLDDIPVEKLGYFELKSKNGIA